MSHYAKTSDIIALYHSLGIASKHVIYHNANGYVLSCLPYQCCHVLFCSAILHTCVVVKVIIRFVHFATIHQVTCIHLHHMPSSTVVKVIVTKTKTDMI